ncbi:toxin VasX [Pseudomonas sp. G.S.17]|uniref:toxin VasX n=1 Tax=Pseudomonas sp. G.S.17 TaxID=3137451 RepID=UPI00311CC60C
MTDKRLPDKDRAYWEARSGGHKDARDSLGTCPLMGKKIQLLPVRYGRVERLVSDVAATPYKHLQRPIGLRLIRDGYLYVIDEASGYLHEYRMENGVPVKLLWQGADVGRDVRSHSVGEATLVFARNSVLHVAYSELQWTAAKCSKVIGSKPDRLYFMQRVDLVAADCEKGGKHLRVENQIIQFLAELAEPPAEHCLTPDAHPEESQDYVWEHQALFREAHIGQLKDSLNAQYQFNHLYLVLEDSIGIMRDLAEEQDTVVDWIEQWTQQHNNEMRYVVGSYIDTLMTIGEQNAPKTANNSDFFSKTTPAQRTTIYDYINARNQWRWEHSKGLAVTAGEDGRYSARRGAELRERPETVIAKREMDAKHAQMVDELGDPLHADLKDEIDALQDSSKGTLEGVGLGSRGIFDLVRHEEMQRYLKRERLHLKRWSERLDAITDDRLHLFTQGEFHRSAWYFDPLDPQQQNHALAMEHNCIRDLCRTDAALEKMSEYFHEYPFYALPVFYGQLDLEFLRKKSGELIKLLNDTRGFSGDMTGAQARISEIERIMGNHWTRSLHLEGEAHSLHQAVSATYIPAIALRMEQWLAEMQAKLDTPELSQHLQKFQQYTNRAQRLGTLVALQQQGATLSIASEADVQKFKDNFTRLNALLEHEENLKTDRKLYDKLARSRMRSEDQRYQAAVEKQRINEELLQTRNQRSAVVRDLEDGISPNSKFHTGYIGVRLNLTQEQSSALYEETRRFRAGLSGGYATEGAWKAGFKSGWIPLLAVGLQVGNLGEAIDTWHNTKGNRTLKTFVIFTGAITGVVSSTLAVYQTIHIAMVDKALQAVSDNSKGQAGKLFAARLGKLGLGLGLIISPAAMIGAVGATSDNWNKWSNAFITGTAGEKIGALAGLTGDIGTTAISTGTTGRSLFEAWGLRRDYLKALPNERKDVLAKAWATRGSRFLQFSIRLTPLGLVFTALQLGGEALFNYMNIDDQQRWILSCCWGVAPKGWNWGEHSQKLAEATLLPQITDKGLQRREADGEPVRTLHLILPGLTLSTFSATSLRWSALLQKSPDEWDAGEALASQTTIISDAPLTLALKIPEQWHGLQALLHLRLAVKPAIAVNYLKMDTNYLNYRIPLSLDTLALRPITAAATSPPPIKQLKEIYITEEILNDIQ